jgi:hypothetical protein
LLTLIYLRNINSDSNLQNIISDFRLERMRAAGGVSHWHRLNYSQKLSMMSPAAYWVIGRKATGKETTRKTET